MNRNYNYKIKNQKEAKKNSLIPIMKQIQIQKEYKQN